MLHPDHTFLSLHSSQSPDLLFPHRSTPPPFPPHQEKSRSPREINLTYKLQEDWAQTISRLDKVTQLEEKGPKHSVRDNCHLTFNSLGVPQKFQAIATIR